MNGEFDEAYARAYDTFYAAKDYEAECDILERAFREYGPQPVRRVVDIGCGTGGHLLPLARRGYEMTGVERAPAMLAIARAKAAARGLPEVTWIAADATSLAGDRVFDAALMMFNVLGYQATEQRLAMALAAVRRLLRDGGLFVFDVWDAAAVESSPPVERTHSWAVEGAEISRRSVATIARATHGVSVEIAWTRTIPGGAASHDVEIHRLRYFHRDELADALSRAGLELLRVGGFPEYWREPATGQWSVTGIARAR